MDYKKSNTSQGKKVGSLNSLNQFSSFTKHKVITPAKAWTVQSHNNDVSENEAQANIQYSPSIKRRPGKFYNKNNIPSSLSPKKSSPQCKSSVKKNDLPHDQRKVTDYFPKSPKNVNIHTERNNTGMTVKRRLNLSRTKSLKLRTREENNTSLPIEENSVLAVNLTEPAQDNVPCMRGINRNSDNVTSTSTPEFVDLTESSQEEIITGINWHEIDNLEKTFSTSLADSLNSSASVIPIDVQNLNNSNRSTVVDSNESDMEEILSLVDLHEIENLGKMYPGGSNISLSSTSALPTDIQNLSDFDQTVPTNNRTGGCEKSKYTKSDLNGDIPPEELLNLIPMMSGSFINYLIHSSQSIILQNKVFTVEDFVIAEDFNQLSPPEKNLYSNLFLRVNNWMRLSKIEYSFIEDIDYSLNELEKRGLITKSFHNEDLEVILEVLNQDEVNQICKQFCKHSKGNKKDKIKDLIKLSSAQRSIFGSSVCDLIKSRAQQLLKSCVKLTKKPRDFFLKLVLTSSYPHFQGDERDRVKDLAQKFFNLKAAKFRYPVFSVSRNPLVFHSKEQFDNYREALQLKSRILGEVDKKNWTEGTKLIQIAKEEFQCFMANKDFQKILLSLPDYLHQFTGGYVYSGIISKGIVTVKRTKLNVSLATECLELLLSQKCFHQRCRGEWYNELALLYETHLKNIMKAYEVIMTGLKDEVVNEISKWSLSHRARKILKRRDSGLNQFQKVSLSSLIKQNEFEPLINTIEARTAPKGSAGLKQLYITELEDGKQISSVEDIVINYFKFHSERRYSKGIHDEGSLIINLALAFFWDVIYSNPNSVDDVFHSDLQISPLDWCSKGFYIRREEIIEERINLLKRPDGIDIIMKQLKELFAGNRCVQSIVNWKLVCLETETEIESLKVFLECLGADVFARIAKHLLKDYRVYRSGFPDLTLWEPDTKRCLIVEVKGPNDTLSDAQLCWLENLHKFGAQAEVCKVENLHSTNGKRKLHNAL